MLLCNIITNNIIVKMKKILFSALMLTAGMMMFISCSGTTPNGNTTRQGEWINDPTKIDPSLFDDKNKQCWQVDMWCDGTTIGREYMWASEAFVVSMIKTMIEADIKVNGAAHKKFYYEKSNPTDEDACTAQEWVGAECWEETIYYTDSTGVEQSETEYCWWPEQNMKERHAYYKEKGLQKLEYKHADPKDKEACLALNPSDDTPVDPHQGEQKDYSKYDNTTEKCWMVTTNAFDVEVISFVWMTERDLVQYYDLMKVDYEYEEAPANDEDSCQELQEDVEPVVGEESCWKITTTLLSQTEINYIWGPESVAKTTVAYIQQSGGTATYTKSTAADEDACDALNE